MRKFYFQKLLTKFLFLFLLLSSTTAFTQNGVITGTVTSSDGEPIPGVIVSQIDKKNQTTTNLDGKFKITLKEGVKVLRFSFMGMKTVEILAVSSTLNVKLEDDLMSLNEVVVVGYGTQLKKDVLGAVSSIKAKDIEVISPVGVLDAMQGRLAGVQILTNNGPGVGAEIKIRGISTLNAGADPLFVVDGQQLESIDGLNPNDIESIEVLKDGASAAIYGSRSANGVVIITTKKGKNQLPQVQVDYVGSYSTLITEIPVANSRQRYDFEQLRSGRSAVPTSSDSLSLINAVSINAQDEILQPAIRNQVSVSFRGGSKNSDYYVSTSYLNDQAIVVGGGYDRINSNINLNFNINKNISAGTRILSSYQLTKGLNEYALAQASFRQTNLPVRDYDGNLFPQYGGRQNPLAIALTQTNLDRRIGVTFFNYAELKIIPSLTFKATVSIDYDARKRNTFDPVILQANANSPARGNQRTGSNFDIQQENYFNYKKSFGKNNVTGLLGVSGQVQKSENASLFADAFANDLIQTFNNVDLLNTDRTNTDENSSALSSIFSRVTYDYNKKYLFSATFRRDGSSRFGSNKRWGNFPSISTGWRVSDENFMKKIKPVLSELKLRASYAITGNQRIGLYEARNLLEPGYFYNDVNGIAPNQIANPNLSWEETKSTNLGVDLEFLKGRLTSSVEWYDKSTDKLLYNVNIPEELGYSRVRQNIGSMRNRGLEITVGATAIKTKSFQWFTSFNIAFNNNKITSLANPEGFIDGAYKIDVGQPLGNFYGYKNLGVFAYNESNAFTDDHQRLTPVFQNGNFQNYTLNGQPYTGNVNKLKVNNVTSGGGDVIWGDINQDFKIDINDRSIIGNGLAKAVGGFYNDFKYKSLSLAVTFDYNLGNDIYRQYDDYRNTGTNSVFTPEPAAIDQSWRKPGDITTFPSLQSNRRQNRLDITDDYLSSGSYIKLRTVRLSYALPKSISKEIVWLNNVSMYVSMNNFVTWTNYDGYNPELGSRGSNTQPGYDRLRYPNKRSVIYGLRVQL
jgi:TonB-linked SusC/RagA family outer membrane protein